MIANASTDMIDPTLSGAIKDWNDYSAESVKNALIVLESITPVKDAIQVTQEMLESIQHTEWKPVGKDLPDIQTLISAGREMADLQKAALERMLDSYRNYLSKSREAAETLRGKCQAAKSPQQLLAAWLEASLELVKGYQEETSQQASNLGTIQAAYKAWLQNTLQNLTTVSH